MKCPSCAFDDNGTGNFAHMCGNVPPRIDVRTTYKAPAVTVASALPAAMEPLAYGIIDPDYARAYAVIRHLAWEEGYAIGLRGSFTRDLDLIAVPWTEVEPRPERFINRICASNLNLYSLPSNPGTKPHGRLVWTLKFSEFGDPRFIDLSIMPKFTSYPPIGGNNGR